MAATATVTETDNGLTYTNPGKAALDVLTAIATNANASTDDRLRAAIAILEYVKL